MAIRNNLCQAKLQWDNSSQPPRYVLGSEDLPKFHPECKRRQETPLLKITHSSHLLMNGLLVFFLPDSKKDLLGQIFAQLWPSEVQSGALPLATVHKEWEGLE